MSATQHVWSEGPTCSSAAMAARLSASNPTSDPDPESLSSPEPPESALPALTPLLRSSWSLSGTGSVSALVPADSVAVWAFPPPRRFRRPADACMVNRLAGVLRSRGGCAHCAHLLLLFAEDSTRKHRFDAALGHPIIAIYARPLPPKTECDELTNSAALVVAANRRAESGCVNDFVVVTLVARTSMRSCEVGDAW